MKLTRRSFLKSSACTLLASSFAPSSWARVRGANEDIRLAVIGFNGQGKSHIDAYKKMPGVRLVALCDVDSSVLNKQVATLSAAGIQVSGYTDIRKLLESPEIDAVSIATPNHWHALGAIWAMQAGKDVYLEKPVSHNVWEGRKIVEAARKRSRIVQTGTQSRSSSGILNAVQWVRAGHLGKITVARGLCYKPRQSIGNVSGAQPVPAHIDYDLWCGPSPKTELRRKNLHYDWHWDFATGNGDLGNQGIHQMDIARWFLGETALSPRVLSVGGRLGYKDNGNTPNTQIVCHDYPAAPLIFEVRGLPSSKQHHEPDAWRKNMDRFMGSSVGVVIHCEGGHILIPDYSKAIAYDTAGKEISTFTGHSDHHANFIAAVRSRKAKDLHADILEGHLSSALCHTGNISYQLGRPASPAAIKDAIKNDSDLCETFDRMVSHLDANGVNLDLEPLVLGQLLKMNPKRETFSNSSAANSLLKREYRKGFEVPNRV